MKAARMHEPEAGWGRKLDHVSAPVAMMAGGVAGVAAGIAAALTAPWPGILVFAGVLALSVGLAARARAITVPMQPFVDPEPARPAIEPAIEAHEEQPPDHEPEPAAEQLIDALAMVDVPGGTFWMGSAKNDEMAHEDERPARLVQVSPFSCMKYPVTRRLWREVMGAPCTWWPEGPADHRPVNRVSWYDAVRFCNAMSEREGLAPCYFIEGNEVSWVSSEGYRLPTEAEWEYACRAGTRTRWSFSGDTAVLSNFAWFDGNADAEPHPVGLKQPNPWGIHDMHGNVWEWCWDWYASYPAPRDKTPEVNPRGPQHGTHKVLRGGAFGYGFRFLRCAFRNWFEPEDRNEYDGFRCVRGLGPQL